MKLVIMNIVPSKKITKAVDRRNNLKIKTFQIR